MLLMSFMLQIWMKLMVLMLLMMSNLTIMTMMMILMMIRPGEGGTFCWLASQPHSPHPVPCPKKIFDSENPGSAKKNSKWVTIDHFLGSWGVLTPTSILIFIALFDCALQKLVYIDQMQVLWKSLKTKEISTSDLSSKSRFSKKHRKWSEPITLNSF